VTGTEQLLGTQRRAGPPIFLAENFRDYACTVRVNGRVVHAPEGMFSPFAIDLTHEADRSRIEIIVAPAPKVSTAPGAGVFPLPTCGCFGLPASLEQLVDRLHW